MTTPPPTRPPRTTTTATTVDPQHDGATTPAASASGEAGGPAAHRPTPERLDDAAHSQVIIEQAKGMLMFLYGIDAADAFEILRWQSQQHNIKVRLIARQILTDLIELSMSKGPARDVRVEGLILTAHQRVTTVATRYRRNHPTLTAR